MRDAQVSIARRWAAVEEARRARGCFGLVWVGGVRELDSEESVRGSGSRSGGLTARAVGLGGAGRPTEMLGSHRATSAGPRRASSEPTEEEAARNLERW
jgi:hypothetical protein